jgi:uncharacterized membrane protein YraQ (UPF0718 family)
MKIVNYLKQNKFLTLVLLAYLVSFILRPDFAAQAFGNSAYYFKEMILIMPMIFLLTVVIDVLIPKEVIISNLGQGSGAKGSLLALVLGSISAGPIYAAFPVSKLLLKKGASIRNIVIILSAWAVIKVPMLANEAKFLGTEFMGTRWILTVLSIFAMSALVSAMVKKEDLSTTEPSPELVMVYEDYCLGCNLCQKMGPQIFEMSEGKARVIQQPIAPKQWNAVRNIAGKCPGHAIQVPDDPNQKA